MDEVNQFVEIMASMTYHCTIIRRATGLALLARSTAASNKIVPSNALNAVVQLGDCLWDCFRQSQGRGDGHREDGDAGEDALKLHDGLG